jgi:hypothetical protein
VSRPASARAPLELRSPDSDQQFVLVLGAPRSGTTLLTSMIGRHPDVAMLVEGPRRALHRLAGKAVVGNKLCVPNQIEMRDRQGLLAKLALRMITGRGILMEGYRLYSIEDHLELLDCKIVGLIRHGNDVISSIMKRGGQPFKVASERWCRAIEVLHQLKRTYPSRVIVLSFEQLVASPRAGCETIARFLGVPFSELMLDRDRYNNAYKEAYPEKGIDGTRANRHQRESIDFDLARQFPDAYRKYEELEREARASVEQAPAVLET